MPAGQRLPFCVGACVGITTACTRRPFSSPLMYVARGAGDAGRWAAIVGIDGAIDKPLKSEHHSQKGGLQMRDVLQNEGPMRTITVDLRSAALIGFILVLPFAVLESLNQPITRQNAPGLFVLFGLLWLLPVAFIVILMPLVRNLRAGLSLMANPINLLLSVASLALIAMLWGGLLIDQMPCFMGAPNCD